MMTDPFGNYLFQKILEKVSEGERTHILSHVQVHISLPLANVLHAPSSHINLRQILTIGFLEIVCNENDDHRTSWWTPP